MAEQDLRGKWKVKASKTSKKVSPLLGCVYQGVSKFSGVEVVGVLLQMYTENDEAVLQTREGRKVSTDLLTLKAIVNE